MKKMILKLPFFLFLSGISIFQSHAQTIPGVKSPDGKIEVTVSLAGGELRYTVSFQNETVLKPSNLGIIREDADLSKNLVLLSSTPAQKVTDNYKMVYAKKRNISM